MINYSTIKHAFSYVNTRYNSNFDDDSVAVVHKMQITKTHTLVLKVITISKKIALSLTKYDSFFLVAYLHATSSRDSQN